MRRNIGVLLCVVLVLITIVAFGHRGSQEGKYFLVAVRFTDHSDGTVTDDGLPDPPGTVTTRKGDTI